MFGELLERRASPTRESVLEQRRLRLLVRRFVRLLAQLLEVANVDDLIGNLKDVARRTCNDLGFGA
jgi:hypothetical protein